MARFGAVIYLTVRFGAVSLFRKTYGAVRCVVDAGANDPSEEFVV